MYSNWSLIVIFVYSLIPSGLHWVFRLEIRLGHSLPSEFDVFYLTPLCLLKLVNYMIYCLECCTSCFQELSNTSSPPPTYVAPMSVQPTRRSKHSSISVASLRRLWQLYSKLTFSRRSFRHWFWACCTILRGLPTWFRTYCIVHE